jgi:osmotically-inducible protein OsmY
MRRIGIAFLGVACLGALACGEQTPLTDATLTQEVVNRLEADRELGPYDLGVATDAGVVTLSGRVGDEDQREEAERLARDVVGVAEVVNELDVMVPEDPAVN